MLLELTGVALTGRLFPFSAQVKAGQVIHLVGPNGAGKSSLLMAIAGLLSARGNVLFAGRALADWHGMALARQRAYLAQQQSPLGQMPVWHYLLMHTQQQGDVHHAMLLTLAQALQLSDKLSRPLTQLSGGEWQRVRLVAVLLQVSHPDGKLLLLDEPLTGLDIAQQAAFDRLIPALTQQGVSVIMSSHDMNHSLRYADCVWLMRPGQCALQGNPQDVLTPEHLSALYQVSFRMLDIEGQAMLTTLS
ncbi:vitamin B12 ABC transporter ATP-binding protein BtuD [Erwinia rhapontici]|uniref:vitamin B12 ABC transporter ATP-binding protein BtuD n=1 Tax=Erwinia rhapontici TaxID=55212 RepID=UPI00143826EA|nr:vitamin B12 ABC transporter ATP-binding protein BtuD [Erwinia rhapontici]NKG32273.1 vitamin B12 ABC transporter ATP-binding protein BtuD [Erwinia rhapontici]